MIIFSSGTGIARLPGGGGRAYGASRHRSAGNKEIFKRLPDARMYLFTHKLEITIDFHFIVIHKYSVFHDNGHQELLA